MESPTRISQAHPQELCLSPSLRRLSTDSASPEFEFCCPLDSSSPLSADQLFSGGVLLPLSLLSLQPQTDPPTEPPSVAPEEPKPCSEPHSASKRWRDIFKKAEKKPEKGGTKEGSEKKKKNKKKGGGGGSGSPELNINIWPFSRSRSAGNGGSRPRTAASAARKVSSAPCSRSNSAGENKSRKWPSSPGRAGVHLARNSPVWQMKRTGSTGLKGCDPIANKSVCHKESGGDAPRRNQPAARVGGSRWGGRASGAGGGKASVLNLNVPMCIGYRQHLSCRGGDSSAIAIGADGPENCDHAGDGVGSSGDGVGIGSGSSSSNLFNLRNLFTKKVY